MSTVYTNPEAFTEGMETLSVDISSIFAEAVVKAYRQGVWDAVGIHRPLMEAADEALAWLRNFRYNVYGVAMSDDNRDHQPIQARLTSVLTSTRKAVEDALNTLTDPPGSPAPSAGVVSDGQRE